MFVLKHKKQANVTSLGFGVFVSPGRETSPGPQVANGSEGEYIALSKEELRNFPELSSPLVDFIQAGNKRPRFVPVTDSRTSAPVVLVIDECLDEPHLQHLQSSLHAFVDSLLPTTRTGIYLSPMHASKEVAHQIFSSLRPYKLNVPEASRDRYLGTAVEVALAIIQGPSADFSRGVVKRPGVNSRTIVCAGGPNTYGLGSVPYSYTHPNYPHKEKSALKWMEHIGREAHQQNTVVDILCAGSCSARVPVLQPLAKASGGTLVVHDYFSEVFGMTYKGHLPGLLVPMVCCRYAVLMIFLLLRNTMLISMENKHDIKSGFILFFAIQYLNVYQADITRVITIRLPTVDSVPEYLQSAEDGVAAVLIAKRTVLGAKSYSDVIDMRTTIDERVKDIALQFSSQVAKSKLHRFPKEISLPPELLFHLRRGPLLGNIVGHEEALYTVEFIFECVL
ncbi:hypothetical protein V6N13_087091 [Hibiscus sabdariffa]